jgi:hypothetical protein
MSAQLLKSSSTTKIVSRFTSAFFVSMLLGGSQSVAMDYRARARSISVQKCSLYELCHSDHHSRMAKYMIPPWTNC